MDDSISRRAAIDVLEKVAELYPWRVPGDRDSYSQYNEAWQDALNRADSEIEALPPAESRIVYCKDCKKHNVEYGYADEICPLISIRGKAKEHEFDYQFCVYGKRK